MQSVTATSHPARSTTVVSCDVRCAHARRRRARSRRPQRLPHRTLRREPAQDEGVLVNMGSARRPEFARPPGSTRAWKTAVSASSDARRRPPFPTPARTADLVTGLTPPSERQGCGKRRATLRRCRGRAPPAVSHTRPNRRIPNQPLPFAHAKIGAGLTRPPSQIIIPAIQGDRRRVADFKSEPRPASNRNRRPTSNRNRWPASSEYALDQAQPEPAQNQRAPKKEGRRTKLGLPARNFWAQISVKLDSGPRGIG